jgi:imidazolonepropionase-like amidohydrolase
LRLDGMIGSLEAGKLADFLVVDGNPLEDIALLRQPKSIESVVLGGKYVKKDGQILIKTPAEGAF